MAFTLEQLNAASASEAAALLGGLYEHSPWIAQAALARRPFASAAHLKHAMVQVLQAAGREAQLALLRAHPELAGKAMQSQALTAESTREQNQAGLTACTPQELAQITQLNAAYQAKFGFPFILAVRGPRGTGLAKQTILQCFARRLQGHPDWELQEGLRNVHRIAEIRLHDKLGTQPSQGHLLWDWQEALAAHSEPEYAAQGQLSVTYLSDAHRACAAHIAQQMQESGFDSVHIDAVGNVVGRYESDSYLRTNHAPSQPISALHQAQTQPKNQPAKQPPYLLTGSHYDTVRNGGKYDGRLGIYVPMLCVRELSRQGQRLPFGIELVAFAEEEGQRYPATFLGSSALVGSFQSAWLEQRDAQGISMREAMQQASLQPQDIAKAQRNPADYLGFVEVHIEQGPVLNALDLPLGVVTSINGSLRYACEVRGTASHAGTTPMHSRRDAAAAVAELSLYLERRAAQDGDSVGTIGMWAVPGGSVNVVPGRCQFTLDLRAPTNAQRDALAHDVLAELAAICTRRGVQQQVSESMRAAAAPSSPVWQQRWEAAVASLGLPVQRMPSGAGHDAMKLHEIMPQAMLFVRGENGGISHNPLESTTSDDMQLAYEAFMHVLHNIRLEAHLKHTHDARPMSPTDHASQQATYQALEAWIDAHFDEQVRFVQALVQVPTDTPPGNNTPHALRAAELLQAMGLAVEQHEVPQALVQAAGLQSITNLVARRHYGAGGITVGLNAHGDVVPPGEGWSKNPYGGEVENGQLFGRAAAVSKCDFATFAFATRALEAVAKPSQGGIELIFTYDEEFGGEVGPAWLLQHGLVKPDLLIAAGFSYQVVTAHNGCLQMELTVHGKMAHAAVPHTGIDALQGATAILNALYAQNTLYQQTTSKVEGIGHPYLNVGMVHGGTNTNVVPGKVVLKLDRRMIPEEDPTQVEANIRQVIAAAVASFNQGRADAGIQVDIQRILLARALTPLPGNKPLVEALTRNASAVFGEPIRASGTPLYTDVRLFGEAGIPGVVYGAGPRTVLESHAKRADERLNLDDLRRATKVVARSLHDLLA